MGGDCLKRRQVNVFHWNGKLVPSSHGNTAKPGLRLPVTTPLPTAYEGLGHWRAATIREYEAATCRFEVKYHDEPKRSSAHLWLPLAVLHFARNPPATAATVRSSPELPTQLPPPPFHVQPYSTAATPPTAVPPALPMIPGLLLPQLCMYGGCQQMTSFAPVLPPPTLPLPPPPMASAPPLQPLLERPSLPLIGSFNSMPAAPASPQASRQGSPERAPGFPAPNNSLTHDLILEASPQSLPLATRTMHVRQEVRQQQPQLPYNGFASGVQLGAASGDDGALAGPAAPTAPPPPMPRDLSGYRAKSVLSLSADSDSGSNNSIGDSAGVGDGVGTKPVLDGGGVTPSAARCTAVYVNVEVVGGSGDGVEWRPPAAAAPMCLSDFWVPSVELPQSAFAVKNAPWGGVRAAVASDSVTVTAAADAAAAAVAVSDDDDLAALYAALCSDETNSDPDPPSSSLRPPYTSAFIASATPTVTADSAADADIEAVASPAAATAKQVAAPAPPPPPSNDASTSCRTTIAAATFMQPVPQPSVAAACSPASPPTFITAMMMAAMSGHSAAQASRLPTCMLPSRPERAFAPAPSPISAAAFGSKRPYPTAPSPQAPPAAGKLCDNCACSFGATVLPQPPSPPLGLRLPGASSALDATIMMTALKREWEGVEGTDSTWDVAACEPCPATRRRIA